MNKPTHDRHVPASEHPQPVAGLRRDELLPGESAEGSDSADYQMSGTAGGGLAAGGLAGTNYGDGSTDDVDIDGALGGSPADTNGDEEESDEPQAGRAGGAVGGTPAFKRSSGE